jgi:hypothetical protein
MYNIRVRNREIIQFGNVARFLLKIFRAQMSNKKGVMGASGLLRINTDTFSHRYWKIILKHPLSQRTHTMFQI